MATKFLGTRDVALRYGLSTWGVRHMVRNGSLPEPIRIGKLLRWAESTLVDFETKKLSAGLSKATDREKEFNV